MDRESFAELVRRHQPGVSRFVGRYLRSREDGDDIVQETFLRAWAQIGRFRPDTNFAAWILTIARFLCMARLKEAQRHPPPAPLAGLHEPSAPPMADSFETLRRACERLPLAQREVVAMRFFDNLDYRSIAQITGDTEVALRSRLHDALERLQSMLKSDS
ncbi:MAG TPA: sigma-70 family RNA polymerase sigma factor [Planctomycetota bacterium]|nr:sigma-70 family RNA polymerase sigma factor [Planctomycetota bacterium]